MAANTENLRDMEKDILLQYFHQHMTMEQRHILMVQQPYIYNVWMGREIMQVRQAESR